MRPATAMTLRSRIMQLLWSVNALTGLFFALMGGAMVLNLFGYDAGLAPLMAHTGTMFAIIGGVLAAYSTWKARSVAR